MHGFYFNFFNAYSMPYDPGPTEGPVLDASYY